MNYLYYVLNLTLEHRTLLYECESILFVNGISNKNRVHIIIALIETVKPICMENRERNNIGPTGLV